MCRIEPKGILRHHYLYATKSENTFVMPSEDHIQELCARVVAERDSEKVAELLAELKAALREHQRETAVMAQRYRSLFKDAA